MKAGELVVGFGVNFTQTGRTKLVWDDKRQSHKKQRERLPSRLIKGEVAAVSSGKRGVQIAVRTPEGESITAHLSAHFDVGEVKRGQGPLTRWRCADRTSGCAAGEGTSQSDVPSVVPQCGAGIDIEKQEVA